MKKSKVAEKEVELTCPDCQGTGEVIDYTYDSEMHRFMEDGTRPCHCQLNLKSPDGDGTDD